MCPGRRFDALPTLARPALPTSSPLKPELIFGLVGPIGCDIIAVENALSRALKRVDYQPVNIRVSDAMPALLELKGKPIIAPTSLQEKIEAGNLVRKLYGNNSVFAGDIIRQIRQHRKNVNSKTSENIAAPEETPVDGGVYEVPVDGTAYIVRQLKRPEEVELLRKTYGHLFIQVSITHSRAGRLKLLADRIRREIHGKSNDECEAEARQLIQIDENEQDALPSHEQGDNDYGQKLTEIFHLGDVFINSESENSAVAMCHRFIDALFGKNNISPTKDEFGTYMAKAASLRSVDLSRQVGAALLTKEGDIISVGCNDVPKPEGGIYWDEDAQKSRDIDRKGEANKEETNRIIFDFLRTLKREGALREDLTPENILADPDTKNAILKSSIGEITEYGRMVHAEMAAITDAARLGRSVKGATLFVTTYPCHNCAKHIISSGINRIVFIEPYPKSRAELLYPDAIGARNEDGTKKVALHHFEGISPRRYRDIFEKGRRRDKSGEVHEWYQEKCIPRVGPLVHNYWLTERHAISSCFPEEEDDIIS